MRERKKEKKRIMYLDIEIVFLCLPGISGCLRLDLQVVCLPSERERERERERALSLCECECECEQCDSRGKEME